MAMNVSPSIQSRTPKPCRSSSTIISVIFLNQESGIYKDLFAAIGERYASACRYIVVYVLCGYGTEGSEVPAG